MSYIFISHSKKNRDYALEVVKYLNQNGYDVWFDEEQIGAGVSWWESITYGVRDCGAIIVIMSSDSKDSQWVKKEILLALDQRKPVFPLLLDGESWEIFIDVQYTKVIGSKLPDNQFLEFVSKVIQPNPSLGKNVHHQESDSFDGFDIVVKIANFFQAFDNKKWSDALVILGEIRASEIETSFDITPYEKKLQDAIEHQERLRRANQEYSVIKLMFGRDPFTKTMEDIVHFLEKYPHFVFSTNDSPLFESMVVRGRLELDGLERKLQQLNEVLIGLSVDINEFYETINISFLDGLDSLPLILQKDMETFILGSKGVLGKEYPKKLADIIVDRLEQYLSRKKEVLESTFALLLQKINYTLSKIAGEFQHVHITDTEIEIFNHKIIPVAYLAKYFLLFGGPFKLPMLLALGVMDKRKILITELAREDFYKRIIYDEKYGFLAEITLSLNTSKLALTQSIEIVLGVDQLHDFRNTIHLGLDKLSKIS